MSDPLGKLQVSLLDDFGSSRVQPGIYRLGPVMYAIHLSQPNETRSGSAYVSSDIKVYDPETGDESGKLRMMIGSLADKPKKRIMMAPSRDGIKVAGPPDVNGNMLLGLAKGDEFKDEEEEELFTGPFLMKLPNVKKMKGNETQFMEELKKVAGVDFLKGQNDGRLLEGYVVELDLRPNAYPNKKKKKEGEQEYDDDVLVPVRLIARPGEALPPGLFGTAGTGHPQSTGVQAAIQQITQQPVLAPAQAALSALTTAPVAPVAPPTAPTGAPTAQDIELAIYAMLPADWAAQRDFIVPLMNQFPSQMPTVLTYVQNPQWLYSPERTLWESDPTKQLIKKRG